MTRVCEACGDSIEGLRSVAKFCSPRCRKAAARQRRAGAAPPAPESEHGLVVAVRRELTALGADETVDGQIALRLAEQVAVTTGAALAKLVEELRRARADAAAGVLASESGAEPAAGGRPEDEVDRARRLRREAQAAAGQVGEDSVARARRRRDEIARQAAEAAEAADEPDPGPEAS